MGPWCAGLWEGLNLLSYLKKHEESTFRAFSGLIQVLEHTKFSTKDHLQI